MTHQPITDWLRAEVRRATVRGSGLSLRGLAREAGADASKISQWLGGRATINLETADRIAAALGLVLGQEKS